MISNEIQFERELMTNKMTISNYDLLNSPTSRLFWITENPLKIALLIVNIIWKIKNRFIVLEAEWKALIKIYTKLILAIIENIKDSNDFQQLMYDHWHNKSQVLDLIAQNKLWSVLQNAKVDLILENIWSGPYEYDMLATEYSVMSKIISPYLLGKQTFFNHTPFQNENIPKLKVGQYLYI